MHKARKLHARVHNWLSYIQTADPALNHQHSYHTMLPSTPPESHASSSASRLDQVEGALDALDLALPPQEQESNSKTASEPPKKRARRDPTPPSQYQDEDCTPKGGIQHRRPVLRASAKRSPRRRSPSPVKTIADLDRLEKPVFITDAETSSTIPPDALDLFKSLRRVSRFNEFVPQDIRDEFTCLLDGSDDVEDRFFTTSAVIGADGSKQEILEELKEVRRICSEAQESSQLCRHEAAWNSAVHHPLLNLAFKDRCGKEPKRRARARVENITSATISGDCVPRWSPADGHDDSASVGVWSVSQDTASSMSTIEEEDPFWMAQHLDSTSHSKAGSKKVDFAVVLEPLPDSALQTNIQAVLSLLDSTPLLSRSMSPSTYMPLIKSPTAIAIETKTVTASRDPLVQLGLIAAAIHRRLHTLPVTNATRARPVTKTGVVVTLPLIAVTNHRWEVYFGCDRGDKIVRAFHPRLKPTMTDPSVGARWAA